MTWRIAAAMGALAILAAVGIGLGAGTLFRPSPTPRIVSVTFTAAPTPRPSPLDEATLFRQPLSAGCATANGVWIVTNGGGVLRWDGAEWSQVDSTLRSLTNVACSRENAFAVGLLGAFVIGDEQNRQIRSADLSMQDLYGVSPLPDGALMVGSNGSVFILDHGDLQIYAQGIDETLYDVVGFGLDSAWAVGDQGITYRLDGRGWNPVGSGQGKPLRAVAATSPSSAVAVGDGGTVVMWSEGAWRPFSSGVEVDLHDVVVTPITWIAGDRGTLLVIPATRGSEPPGTPPPAIQRVDLRTECDLLSIFKRGDEIWVVGRSVSGGGVWSLRQDGSLIRKWGRC